MIKLNECELDYPSITRFKVWVGKVYMGEYTRTEVLNRFGEMWLDYGKEVNRPKNTSKINSKWGVIPKYRIIFMLHTQHFSNLLNIFTINQQLFVNKH